VVSSGPVAQVLTESPAFAPQLAKVLGRGWLTVDQVRQALAPVDDGRPDAPTSAVAR
jgi:energy-coupling factor transport system ATP-binding protein